MKTVEEIMRQIATSKELQEELKAASEEQMKAFFIQHGCDAEDVQAFLSRVKAQGECRITDAEADAVAGGAGAGFLQYLRIGYFPPV